MVSGLCLLPLTVVKQNLRHPTTYMLSFMHRRAPSPRLLRAPSDPSTTKTSETPLDRPNQDPHPVWTPIPNLPN